MVSLVDQHTVTVESFVITGMVPFVGQHTVTVESFVITGMVSFVGQHIVTVVGARTPPGSSRTVPPTSLVS